MIPADFARGRLIIIHRDGEFPQLGPIEVLERPMHVLLLRVHPSSVEANEMSCVF